MLVQGGDVLVCCGHYYFSLLVIFWLGLVATYEVECSINKWLITVCLIENGRVLMQLLKMR